MTATELFQRHNESFVADTERRILIAIARRLPAFVTPDRLTAFGVFGALVVLVGYAASAIDLNVLWVANAGLLMHWLGDSLDGTLARVRGIERPRYGFFLDQSIDTVGNLLIAVGIGLSPWARLDIALLVLAAYHMLSIYVFVRSIVSREFHVALRGVGPTEMRLGIFAMTLGIWLFGAPYHTVFDVDVTWCDLLMLLTFVGLLVLFVVEVACEARHLAATEKLD
ncbi:MAG: CDP-alcohol phosphatidyltransferase family protein [Ancalomicrobiaceae bacterium]|nr:CDP-alcohol phosphatidyltransferase family protein [Ancalomicrobiaceae bacterium]